MGLSDNDQKLIKYLLGRQLIGAEAVVRLTLQASERNTTFLQVVMDAKLVDPAHLKPFLSAAYPATAPSISEDDSQTVISSESQRLAQSGEPSSGTAITNALLPPAQSSLPRPNSRFGPFMLYEMIGQGGMGMVFRAKHIDLDRECAVKILVAQENSVDEALIRFTAEAKTFAQLDQHPHIVRVIDAGQVGPSYYISMELVEGMSFREAIVRGQLDLRTRVKYVAQIADALVAVHSRGIIHRDIKPGNILVDSECAKLTDFGIAKNTPKADGLTLTGSVLGTLAFMPPEQAENSKDIGFQADIYSLGAVLYYALTGRAPHVGASTANVIASLLTRAPERPRLLNPKIPVELEKIVLIAMSREVGDRYQSAAIFRDTLLQYLERADAGATLPQKASRRTAPRVRRSPKKPSSMPALIASVIVIIGLAAMGFVISKQKKPAVEDKTAEQEKAATTPAKISKLNLKAGQWVTASRLEITGQLDKAVNKLILSIDGQEQRAAIDGSFAFKSSVALKDGVRELKISEVLGSGEKQLALVPFQVDTIKPQINLEDVPKTTDQSSIILKGTVEDAHLASVTVNNKKIQLVGAGFEETVELKMGKNSLSILAIDKAGLRGTVELEIERSPVKLALNLKESPRLIRESAWTFKGAVSPKEARLSFDGQSVKVTDGAFEKTVALGEGKNEWLLVLSYGSKTTQRRVSMTCDTVAPVISIESPKAQYRGKISKVQFSLKSQEEASFQLSVAQQTVSSAAQSYNLTFRNELRLKDGLHSYKVTATDRAGNKSEASGQLVIDTTGPAIDFEIDWDKSDKRRLALKGTIKDLSKIKRFTLGGSPVTIKGDQFTKRTLRSKLKSGLFFEAKDELGNQSKVRVQFDLVLLKDRKKWQAAGKSRDGRKLQDAEISIVAKRLGKAFEYVNTKAYSCGGENQRIATFKHKKTSMEFNLVPGGQFLMGTKVTPPDSIGVSPPCQVKIRPFLIARFEIKQKEWRIYDQTVTPTNAGPDRPMSRMSWLHIAAWVKKAGDGLRLPSESEWEYACRAGTTTEYFWGSAFDQSYVWSDANSGGQAQPGRRHEAAEKWNAFGLIDMIGNLWEWVADSGSPGYDEIPPPKDGSPYKQANNKSYMNRGGFWGSTGDELKQWYRDSSQGVQVSNQLGARLSLGVPDK